MTNLCSSALLALVIIATSMQATECLEVGFGELDYSQVESNKGIEIDVLKRDTNVGRLVCTVSTKRYDEIDVSRKSELQKLNLPDPAEYEEGENGRRDFARVVKRVTFEPSQTFQEKQLFLPFVDDDINELNEGFVIEIKVDEEESNPEDVANLKYRFNGVALIRITNDDEISISFGKTSYEVGETDGRQDKLITLIKDDNIKTERDLEVVLQLAPGSGIDAATFNQDFALEKSTISMLVFPSTKQVEHIPFTVIDDNVAEFREQFQLFIAVPQDGGYRIGDKMLTAVYITDDDSDGISIEFQQPEYTVREGDDEQVQVCLTVVGVQQFEFFLQGTFTVTAESAQASLDFIPPTENTLTLEPTNPRPCINIGIVDDERVEATEEFGVTIVFSNFFNGGLQSVINKPVSTTVIIQDNDVQPAPPPCSCGTHATCVNNRCVCVEGYEERFGVCEDIDECAEDRHNCHFNAVCRNTDGGYRCECKAGFTGSGFFCGDVDECTAGLHRCHHNAVCINTRGGYRCECRAGYTGDGYTCRHVCENCGSHAVCENNECVCNKGYRKREGVCIDIDECTERSHNCHYHATCKNTEGGFTCECRPGYTGDGHTCHSVCANCGPHAVCENNECVCVRGYEKRNGVCTDINECHRMIDDCHVFAHCENTEGSFTCTCREGFVGNGQHCRDENECLTGSHNCPVESSICLNRIGSFECRCRPGFQMTMQGACNRVEAPTLRVPAPEPDCTPGTRRGRSRSRCGTRDRTSHTHRTRTRHDHTPHAHTPRGRTPMRRG